MYKFISIYLFLFYCVPFFIAAIAGNFYYSLLPITLLFLAFFIPLTVLSSKKLANYEKKFLISSRPLILIALIYFILRIDYLIEITTHILDGSLSEYTLSLVINRYAGDESQISIIQKMSAALIVTYGSLLAWYESEGGLFNRFLLIFIVMLVVESMSLARAGALLALSAFISDFVVRKNNSLCKYGGYEYFKKFFIIILLMLLIFYFSAYFRLSENDYTFSVLYEKTLTYSLASYEALLIWLVDFDLNASTYGLATFTAIYKIFGYVAPQGFYSPIDTSYGLTNVYTNIRGLLSDFGMVGALVIFSFMGLVIKYCSMKEVGFLGFFILRNIIFFLIFLFISPFNFFSTFFGFQLSFLILMASKSTALRNCLRFVNE
jgi:oligosaccharide repeat unit polymerase